MRQRKVGLALATVIASVFISGCESAPAERPSSRLDPDPGAGPDPVARITVTGGTFADAPMAAVAQALATQSNVPFMFYGEGLETERVTLAIPPGTALDEAARRLAAAAGAHHAYYADVIDEGIVGGMRITRRPYRSYARGELGRRTVLVP